MDIQMQNTASPPSYTPQGSAPYPEGQTPYPPSGPQQYPPPDKQHAPAIVSPQYVGAPPSQQLQEPQQQQGVVVSCGQPQAAVIQHVDSYVGHIVFACFVVWCCNWLFGLSAFILAS